MKTDRNGMVVTPGACEGLAVRTTHLHHHDFPEMRAEGESPVAAGTNLANLFVYALDSTPNDYRRAVVTQALADVQAFVAQGG